jgi:transposase
MICPRCREHHDILRFIPMGLVEEFREDTVPVYKCPSCRWIFAPAQNVREEYWTHDRDRK